MKILIPIDFSQHAENACHYALHLAAHTHAELLIFNAYRLPVVDPVMPMDYLGELTESIRQKSEKDLAEFLAKMQDYITRNLPDKEIEINTHLELGFPADEIIKKAKSEQVDLILMGTRHLDGFQRFLAGSIHSVLIEKAACPVWVIPENATYPLGDVKFMFASNLEEEDKRAVRYLLEIARQLKASLRIVHFAPEGLKESEQALQYLKNHFSEELNTGQVHLSVFEDNNVYEGILDLMEDEHFNVSILLTRKRAFFESIFSPSLTEKIVKKSQY